MFCGSGRLNRIDGVDGEMGWILHEKRKLRLVVCLGNLD